MQGFHSQLIALSFCAGIVTPGTTLLSSRCGWKPHDEIFEFCTMLNIDLISDINGFAGTLEWTQVIHDIMPRLFSGKTFFCERSQTIFCLLTFVEAAIGHLLSGHHGIVGDTQMEGAKLFFMKVFKLFFVWVVFLMNIMGLLGGYRWKNKM